MENQKRLIRDLEAFQSELQPQLDNAKREIELNKSMLDMLNNEIQMLNSEKLDLEKRLLTTRRNQTPSVIIEEDEAELEEEEKQMMMADPKPRSGGRRKRHRRKANGAALERIVENEEEEIERENGEEQSEPSDDGEETSGSDHSREDKTDETTKSNSIFNDYTHDSEDHMHINSNFIHNNYDIELLHKRQMNNQMTADGILILNKQIEDMTFYVDELKSELEAEREKSNEYQNEIRTLQQRLEHADEQEAVLTSSIKAENERLQKELVDALLRLKESETRTESSAPSINEQTVDSNTSNPIDKFDKSKFERLLSIIKEDLLTIEDSSALNLDRTKDLINDQEFLGGETYLKDFVESLLTRLGKYSENYERECERVKYIENQMAKAVQDFRQEISSLEVKLDENQKEYINFKLQVS